MAFNKGTRAEFSVRLPRFANRVPDLRGYSLRFVILHVLHDYFYREMKNDNDLLVNFIPEE